MPRTITYEIQDRPDGCFRVTAQMAPDRVYRRDDLATLAQAEEWVDGLRALMAACGAPVVLAEAPAAAGSTPASSSMTQGCATASGAAAAPDVPFRLSHGGD